jgi:hypothetical protein
MSKLASAARATSKRGLARKGAGSALSAAVTLRKHRAGLVDPTTRRRAAMGVAVDLGETATTRTAYASGAGAATAGIAAAQAAGVGGAVLASTTAVAAAPVVAGIAAGYVAGKAFRAEPAA